MIENIFIKLLQAKTMGKVYGRTGRRGRGFATFGDKAAFVSSLIDFSNALPGIMDLVVEEEENMSPTQFSCLTWKRFPKVLFPQTNSFKFSRVLCGFDLTSIQLLGKSFPGMLHGNPKNSVHGNASHHLTSNRFNCKHQLY